MANSFWKTLVQNANKSIIKSEKVKKKQTKEFFQKRTLTTYVFIKTRSFGTDVRQLGYYNIVGNISRLIVIIIFRY